MSNKLFLASSFLLSALGFVFTNSVKFGFCISNQEVREVLCINFFERVGDPLFYGGLALFAVFVLLTFLPQAFNTWKKFATWFIPLAILLFIFYPNPGAGDYFSPYPEQVFKWTSILYVAISTIVIGLVSVKKK